MLSSLHFKQIQPSRPEDLQKHNVKSPAARGLPSNSRKDLL